jgi:hypothetical protein
MKKRSRSIVMTLVSAMLAALFSFAAPGAPASGSAWPGYLYKTTFVRAAPGKLLDLIALCKSRM